MRQSIETIHLLQYSYCLLVIIHTGNDVVSDIVAKRVSIAIRNLITIIFQRFRCS